MKNIIILIYMGLSSTLYARPEYIQEQQNPNRFTRTLISEGTVNNDTVTFFSRNPQLSAGYSWQIDLSGCVGCSLIIHVFASDDCVTFSEIFAPDATVPVPISISDNGTTLINVSNVYYLCSQIAIENTLAETVTYKATISVKETY